MAKNSNPEGLGKESWLQIPREVGDPTLEPKGNGNTGGPWK